MMSGERRTPRPAGTGAAFKDEQLRRQLDQTEITKASHAQLECRECGAMIQSQRETREFCSKACRSAFHNRRSHRGAQIYDLAMAWRFDRKRAAQTKALTLLCRALARYHDEDRRSRARRRSWDDPARTKSRDARLSATLCGLA
jgi:hypothetical protein